jgi:outer membrane receptor for ferric coprogen and ferric-rhodotorulic acid
MEVLLKTCIRATLAAAVACSLVLPAYAYVGEAMQIKIPAGDLDRALESLAQQADINLLYQPAEMQGVKTNGVNATLTPR